MKPLQPWVWAGFFLFGPMYFLMDGGSGHKALHFASGAIFWTCWLALTSINTWYGFETLRAPGSKWYIPWSEVQFSIPSSVRILVRDVSAVSSWYVEKLGLHRLAEKPGGESAIATYEFKNGGKSIVLTTRRSFETQKTPMLFSTKIDKMKDVLAARGIEIGAIERDRQGIRYFQIHDPEGNVIEVVEGR